MKVLIVGLGSISKKHITAIRRMSSEAKIYALRSGNSRTEELGVRNIYNLADAPEDLDFCIISNPTSEHGDTIKLLSSLKKPLLIEKPVLSSLDNIEALKTLFKESRIMTYVGCNLRFHPVIERLKQEMNQRRPIEMNVYCGTYLPDWRPQQDYRKVYSAKSSLGGGVHLDLIHEIDYTTYLLGLPKTFSSYLGKKSSLEINSKDIAHYVLEYDHSSVFITLNYYRRDAKRQIECVWEDEVWIADLIKGEIANGQGDIIFTKPFEVLETYYAQLNYFWDCIQEERKPMNDFSEAIEVLKICLN